MSDKLRWGILGAGRIAGAFARDLKFSQTGELIAIGSRDAVKADAFARQFGPCRAYGSYEQLLADPLVQAVYIATPHPQHVEWAIKSASAGKHLLVEKPIAMNFAETMQITEAAIENDVFLMEAFMYRCHPQTAKLVELIRDGAIGDVRVIQASFGFNSKFDPESRIYNNALGGGGILDVGCYAMSMARLIAGVANGRDIAEPLTIQAAGKLGQTGVDEWTSAVLQFPGGIIAQLSTAVACQLENVVRIFGSEGSILVPHPWVPAREGASSTIQLHKPGDKSATEIIVDCPDKLYAIEADTVARNLACRMAPSPAMTPQDSLGNMRALDAWRSAIGLVYESEKPQNCPKRSLKRRDNPPMQYGGIRGIDMPVSRLVMGVDNQTTFPQACAMFDDFFERGGNCFDTAYVYGGGLQERLLGQWIRHRNVRDEVVVIIKGAHTPHCNPESLSKQLEISLDRLQVDHADVYLMHRDNPEVPVGEFVDVLNEHLRARRVRAFGGSNWSLVRVEQANEYAQQHGLVGFSVVCNNFSLARMVKPVWVGCISASDSASRTWLTRAQLPLLAWSSQARGFFLDGNRGIPDDDAELARCWFADDNFARLERARQLAERKGCSPINIALAYVLNQPFPTFALIGPRQLSETRTSLPALTVSLSEAERNWLVDGSR